METIKVLGWCDFNTTTDKQKLSSLRHFKPLYYTSRPYFKTNYKKVLVTIEPREGDKE